MSPSCHIQHVSNLEMVVKLCLPSCRENPSRKQSIPAQKSQQFIFIIIFYQNSNVLCSKVNKIRWQLVRHVSNLTWRRHKSLFTHIERKRKCIPTPSVLIVTCFLSLLVHSLIGYWVLSRFLDQVGHETMYASSGNKHVFTK